MKKEEWNEGLNHLDPDLVEKYIEQKDNLRQKNKKPKGMWLRVGAIAACFALIIGAVITVPMLIGDDPGILPIPGITDDKDAVLSADEVGKMFSSIGYYDGTNRYTKVFSSSPEYLGIVPLPNAEYLPLYSTNKYAPAEKEFISFIGKYSAPASALFDIALKKYEIEKDINLYGNIVYSSSLSDRPRLIFSASGNWLYFYCYGAGESWGEGRLKINGNMVSVLESDTDEQIKEKLKDTIDKVCASFNHEYTSIQIKRGYSNQQLVAIRIYLYSTEETIFPSNCSGTPITSDYIALTLDTDRGPGSYYNWGGSKDEAFLTNMALYKTSQKASEHYKVDAESKMLTLEEAEQLLEKGYVFGGHSCPLCMAGQPEVDFSDYNYVTLEYVSDINKNTYMPFYAFYKYIGETKFGIGTYAKTYVPAIQVSGYEEYFEMQKENHKSIWDTEPVG